MLSSDINSKVKYYSGAKLDKVVKVFTGTYSSGDLITRVGSISTIYVYRIPHGLPRPVFCELLWSDNGGTTWHDSDDKLAFSDSTYVYIFHGYATTGTPVMYKVYCSWIDGYDGTNPSVDVSTYSDNQIQFDARLNYQKIYTQQELSISPGTFGSTTTQIVTQDIGTTPNAKAWFQPFANEVWPVNYGGTSNFFLYDFAQDEAYISIDSNSVDLTVARYSNATRRAWVRIYYDGS